MFNNGQYISWYRRCGGYARNQPEYVTRPLRQSVSGEGSATVRSQKHGREVPNPTTLLLSSLHVIKLRVAVM